MRSKILLALSLLFLLGVVRAHAYPACACTCASSCTASCVGTSGLTTCGAIGTCTTSVGCGGGGRCLTASTVDSLLGRILERPAVVPVDALQGRAAARLTWRLTQHVEEASLGEVTTAGAGFLLADGLGKVRAPELAFVSREHAHAGSPDLVAEFLSSSTSGPVARQNARSWLQAGTQAVLVVDSTRKTVTVYRGAKAPEVAGQGGLLDLTDVVQGFSLRIDDLFE
jgi:Uma2 family endonuclease